MAHRTVAGVSIALCVLSGTASATTRSSFRDVDGFSGVSVIPLSSLSYQVTLAVGATMTENSVVYGITDIIGFYALTGATGPDFAPLYSLSTLGSFGNDSTNSGPGGIQGWKAANANVGITNGNSFTFTFNNLDLAHFGAFGFHLRLTSNFPGTSDLTGNATGSLIPAPGALGVLGMGMLAFARRRR